MVNLTEPKFFEIGLLALNYLGWRGFTTDDFTFRIPIDGKLTAIRLCIISGLNRDSETDWRTRCARGQLRSLDAENMSRLFIQARR